METIKIPFTGINRSIDEAISQDGQCMELINARIKNSSVEPIGIPVILGELPMPCKRLYYHPLAKKYIAIAQTGEAYSLNEDYTIAQTLSSDLTGKVNDIQFLGNIACVLTDTQIIYELFENNKYNHMGTIPELPPITITQDSKVQTITPDIKFLGGRISDWSKYDFTRTAQYNAVGYFDNCIDSLNKEGYMLHPCLLKYAFRSYTGEYIQESPIFLVEHRNILSHTFMFGGHTGGGEVEFNQIYPFQYGNNEPGSATIKDYTYEFGVMGTRIRFSFPSLARPLILEKPHTIHRHIHITHPMVREERNKRRRRHNYIPRIQISKQSRRTDSKSIPVL